MESLVDLLCGEDDKGENVPPQEHTRGIPAEESRDFRIPRVCSLRQLFRLCSLRALARALVSANMLPENLSGNCFHRSTFFLVRSLLSYQKEKFR